ncbi:VWA domain-containing protein, partial [bacterium]|nr:VWA domain-containing protein [bacterium]
MWPLRFAHPLALVLIPLVVMLARRWRPLRRACPLTVLLLLALALAGPERLTERARIVRLYALDVSGSTFVDTQAALAAIAAQARALPPSAEAGVLLFADSSALLVAPTPAAQFPTTLASDPIRLRTSASDIASAVRTGSAEIAERHGARQLVLLTDGRSTRGDPLVEAALAAQAGVRVFTAPLGPTDVADARVASLSAPVHVAAGAPFPIAVELLTTADIHVGLSLLRDGKPLGARRDFDLRAGQPRRLVLEDTLAGSGLHTYEARLDAPDRCPQNNAAQALVRVEGKVHVAVLARSEESAAARLLRASADLSVSTRTALRASDLDSVGVLVLDDAPAAALDADTQKAIRTWVVLRAGGLVALGGPHSFGPGGYQGTPVEQVLPVRCTRPETVAIVVALDRSGSMAEKSAGRSKMACAREAVLRSLQTLLPTDQLALLAFDTRPELIRPLGPLPDPAALAPQLDAIQPQGPTAIGPAVGHALQLLQGSDAKVRHVLVVSDGQSADFDPAALRERFQTAGITLSVLMTGEDATAITRLQALAGDGFRRVTDATTLPTHLIEALRKAAFGDLVREGQTTQTRTGDPTLTQGVTTTGTLAGYVRTAPKPMAFVEWTAGSEGDPLFAHARRGLGRSVAFTSTVGTTWDAPLWQGDAAARLLLQAVRWAARPPSPPGVEAEWDDLGGTFRLTVHAVEGDAFLETLRLSAHVAPPEGDATTVSLAQTAPGQYSALIPAEGSGVWHAMVIDESRRLLLQA